MKQALRELVAAGKSAQALETLRSLKLADADLANLVLQLSARQTQLRQQELAGTIASDAAGVERNQINAALLALIGQLPEAALDNPQPPRSPKPPTVPSPIITPSVLLTFAANDLSGVQDEAHKIWASVSRSPLVSAAKIEHASIEMLADAIIDSQALFMFHFGGHADQNQVVLDGLLGLDKIRLSRLIAPDGHQIQLMFLNGCLSYGQVGLLTAKGVKAIIATNVKVNDAEAVRIAAYFYKLFFEKDKSLKSAFETAEATVSGRNAYPIIVNPGEIDEHQPMPSSWTLFVNDQHKEVMDWTLADFVASAQQTAAGQKQRGGSSRTVQQHGDKSVYIEDHTGDITIS